MPNQNPYRQSRQNNWPDKRNTDRQNGGGLRPGSTGNGRNSNYRNNDRDEKILTRSSIARDKEGKEVRGEWCEVYIPAPGWYRVGLSVCDKPVKPNGPDGNFWVEHREC